MSFMCEECHANPKDCLRLLSGMLSYGPCEDCGKVASCADCRCPGKPRKAPETPSQEIKSTRSNPVRVKKLKTPIPPLKPEWAAFLRGRWTTQAPTKPGVYPAAGRTGEPARDQTVIGLANGNVLYCDRHTTYKDPKAAWGGWWWSEPRPELPPAPKSWPTDKE